jgi:hypothetical protein
MKKVMLMLALVAGSYSLLADQSGRVQLTRSQATNYIKHVIDTLVSTQNHSGSYAHEINAFVKKTTQKLLHVLGSYHDRDFWSLKSYTQDELYAAIIGEIITFIEDRALAYSQEDIKKFFVHGKVDTAKVGQRVSILIRDEALKVLTQNGTLKPGILEHLAGSALRGKVNNAIKRELKHIPVPALVTAQPKPSVPMLYTTKECPVCLEDFGSTCKRLSLTCGHNICVSCLRKWYDKKGAGLTCPYCIRSLNILDYAECIFV